MYIQEGYDNRSQKTKISVYVFRAGRLFPLTDNAHLPKLSAEFLPRSSSFCLHETSVHAENQKFGSQS